MNVYKKFLHIIKLHAEAFVVFEILMRSIGFLLGSLLVLLFDLALKQDKGGLLINADLVGLFEGYRFIFLALAVFALLYVSLIEIVGLCYISAHEQKGAHVLAVLRYAVKRSSAILSAYGLHIIFFVFLAIFFFPVFDIGPSYIKSTALPPFIVQGFTEGGMAPYLFGALGVIVCWFILRSLFTFHLFALNKKNIISAFRGSWKLTARSTHLIASMRWGVITPVLFTAVLFLATACISYIILLVLNASAVMFASVLPVQVSLVFYASWIYLLTTIVSLMVGPLIISLISAYLLIKSPKSVDKEVVGQAGELSRKTTSALRAGVGTASCGHIDSYSVVRLTRRPIFIFTLGLLTFSLFILVTNSFLKIYTPVSKKPVIVSHRGIPYEEYDKVVPENTIKAFEKARLALPTIGIETDAQLTKDGSVVLFHDQDLLRIYNNQTYIQDMTYQDLLEAIGTTTNILQPSKFDDLVRYMRTSSVCPSLIEIKDYGSFDTAQKNAEYIIQKIRQFNLYDCAHVGSFDVRLLGYIKALDPNIKTNLYVYTKAGDISEVEHADIMSVEYSLINEQMINTVHAEGKLIYAWTVNSPKKAKELYTLGIDGIITDNPSLIQTSIDQYDVYLSKINPYLLTVFGKTFFVDLGDAWKLRLPLAW